MSKEISWLTVGKLVSPQGLRGEIRVNPSSDFPERFTSPGDRWLQKNNEEPKKIKLISGRQLPGKSLYVVTFLEISNRDQAESLVGQKLLVPSSDRPNLASNEFHLLDLLGLKVRLIPEDKEIGEVIDLTSAGNDLLEIKLFSNQTVLVPFVKEIVPEVSIEQGWLKILPPPGLLDL